MKIGFIGLGKMGLNMVTRLVQSDVEVVGHARTAKSIKAAEKIGAIGSKNIKQLVRAIRESPHQPA